MRSYGKKISLFERMKVLLNKNFSYHFFSHKNNILNLFRVNSKFPYQFVQMSYEHCPENTQVGTDLSPLRKNPELTTCSGSTRTVKHELMSNNRCAINCLAIFIRTI